MVIRIIQNKIKAVELSKAINQRKANYSRKYDMKMNEETLNKDTSMKITRRILDIWQRVTVCFKR